MRVLWSGIRVDDDRKDFGDTDDKSLEGNINNDDDLGLIDVESTFIIDNVPIKEVCECIEHVLTFKYLLVFSPSFGCNRVNSSRLTSDSANIEKQLYIDSTSCLLPLIYGDYR